MTALRLACPAKLNLYLRIVGRRSDGYHLLATLLHALDLVDDLYARPAAHHSLTIAADDVRDALPVEDDNLVLRAARAFASAWPQARGVAFHLHKRIPHGGGLGGGSSDAAAALRLCNALHGAPLTDAQLAGLARGLGADVAFFLRGGSQWAYGIGDELARAEVPPGCFTLLAPPFGCPTKAVYENFAARWNQSFDAASIRDVRDSYHNDFASRGFVNDLTAAAERVRPELALLRRRAGDLGVGAVAMTGSGSTLFVAAPDAAQAQRDRARLAPLGELGVRLLAARSAPERPEPEAAIWPADAKSQGGGG